VWLISFLISLTKERNKKEDPPETGYSIGRRKINKKTLNQE
jgi:hypothetical protein